MMAAMNTGRIRRTTSALPMSMSMLSISSRLLRSRNRNASSCSVAVATNALSSSSFKIHRPAGAFAVSVSASVTPRSKQFHFRRQLQQQQQQLQQQQQQQQRRGFSREILGGSGSGNRFGTTSAAAAAAATSLFLAAATATATATATTACEESASTTADPNIHNNNNNNDDDDDDKPEIDPYDNLPEEDEPTHCSICLTYRQGPCRPYWRKVEACTKDHEKQPKTKKAADKGDGDATGNDDANNDDDDLNDPSTRCFQYMMPWIDCASKFRNLYTLIEMDTNYTEGIEELEATSHHFCWMPGTEPKIDWTGWWEDQSDKDGDDNDDGSSGDKDDDAPPPAAAGVALWKTLDPALGDPKLVTIEARVPAVVAARGNGNDNDSYSCGEPGILECAYATDQDNNVIGFAYGTKPSELLSSETKSKSETKQQQQRNKETGAIGDSDGSDTNTNATTAEGESSNSNNNNDDDDDDGEKTILLSIHLVASRTQNFVLSASYTHRRIDPADSGSGASSSSVSANSDDGVTPRGGGVVLESHLYKSKPFSLADVPKVAIANAKA